MINHRIIFCFKNRKEASVFAKKFEEMFLEDNCPLGYSLVSSAYRLANVPSEDISFYERTHGWYRDQFEKGFPEVVRVGRGYQVQAPIPKAIFFDFIEADVMWSMEDNFYGHGT